MKHLREVIKNELMHLNKCITSYANYDADFKDCKFNINNNILIDKIYDHLQNKINNLAEDSDEIISGRWSKIYIEMTDVKYDSKILELLRNSIWDFYIGRRSEVYDHYIYQQVCYK
jgi:hypothetical protein